MEKAVIAYLHEAAGKDMLQEAVHKLHHIEGCGAHPARSLFTVLEKDTAFFDLDDSGVGDGDPEDVRGQVLDAVLLSGYGLGVDVPVLLPDVLRDLIEQSGLVHFMLELCLADLRQGVNREEEVGIGGKPLSIRHGAPRGDVVDMWMVLLLTPPMVLA